MQNIEALTNRMYTQIDVDEAFRIDAKPYTNRPFYAGSFNFNSTSPRYSFLNTNIKYLPGDVIRSNPSLVNAMKIGAYYRSDLLLNISMAGTITHAGCVLVGCLPPIVNYPSTPSLRWINSILSGPHAFLYANEATSVNLTIPWYCNSDMATLNLESSSTDTSLDITTVNGNYATLVFMVLNPLTPSTGSSASLSIIIEACFKNLDILVPTPRFIEWVPQIKMLDGIVTTVKSGLKKSHWRFYRFRSRLSSCMDWFT